MSTQDMLECIQRQETGKVVKGDIYKWIITIK